MGFKKGNLHGQGRVKGSKNKKTIIKESLDLLNKNGITPLVTSKEIIDSLVQNSELKPSEQIQLLNTMTSLFRYELLTRSEEIKLDELQKENVDLQEENKKLKNDFIGTPLELLKQIQGDTDE